MLGKSANQNQYNLFKPLLKEFIDPSHKLVKLADAMDWKSMEKTFAPLYPNIGSRAKPVRLMAGLLILKQLYNLSDEALVSSFVSNPYFQYFCGLAGFEWRPPCDPSDLVHFRKRLGPQGIEELFKQSIALFQQKVKQSKTVLEDSTVQEKNITYPTDNKLHTKIIKQCWKIAQQENISLRQRYSMTLKKLQVQLRLSRHSRRIKEAGKARKKLKTIAGRLYRDLRSKLKVRSLSLIRGGIIAIQ